MRLSSAILFSTFSAAASFMTPLPNTSSNTKSTSLFASTEVKPLGIPGTAKLDKPWKELGFEFRPTKSNLRITHKNGEWGEFEMFEVRLIFRQDSISVTHDERNILHFLHHQDVDNTNYSPPWNCSYLHYISIFPESHILANDLY